MAIQASEIKFYRSAVNDDTGSNGGRMDDSQEAVDNQAKNVWPDLFGSDLSAGLTRWRKVHARIENAANLDGENTGMYLEAPIASDARLYLAAGDHIDVQSGLGTPNLFGAGQLNATVSAGATSIGVLVEDGTTIIFRDTEEVWISDGTNQEFATISGTPSVAGDVVTITLAAGLANGYNSSNTFVASIVDFGTVATAKEAIVVTSAAGTFDSAQLTVPNIGAIYQNWTITFTSSTAFTLDGDTLGTGVATGNISTTLAPTNPNTGTPYFSIAPAAWGGTWATNDTVTFRTVPAAMTLWEKLVVDAATPAVAGVVAKVGFKLNSAA